MRRWLIILLTLTAAFLVGLGILFRFGPAWAKAWVESPGFCRMISHEVSKSMKLYGEFAPLTLDGLTATTDSYEGTGWPGEAIGSLEAKQIKAVFNPWAIFQRVWQIDRIDIGEGRFVLRQPNDALKLHPTKAPPPWYAIFMPSRFYCKWIETPKADVEFAVLGQTGKLKQVKLGATMIGRDFKYYAHDGSLEAPMMPELGVTQLTVLVTREKAEFDTVVLHGLNGDPAHAELSGRLGMREDKSLKADISLVALPFNQALPEELQKLLTGRISGHVLWETDKTGKKTDASGNFELLETRLKAWKWLEEIARVHNNPDLLEFVFDQASCRFTFHDKRFETIDLNLHAAGKAHVTGTASYDLNTKSGTLDVDLDEIPVAAWLPEEFKPRVEANLRGHLFWNGAANDLNNSQARGNLNLDNTEIKNPVRLREIFGEHKLRVPDYFWFDRARLDFSYKDQLLFIDSIDLHSPDTVDFTGSGCWTHANYLQLNLAFQFKKIAAWLPKKLEKHLTGDLSGRIDWSCENGKMHLGNGSGTLNLDRAELRDFKFQQAIVRFLKDDSFLRLPLQAARIDWEQYQSKFTLRQIDILSPGKLGVRGTAHISPSGTLSGKLRIGLNRKSLQWLPEAETAVFTENTDGLHWATVTLSGTVKKPQQDLTAQIMRVLQRHPIALIEMAFRGLSWWLGDLFGTYEPPQ